MCVTPNSKPLPWDCAAPPPFTSTASGSKAATLSKAWSAPCWPQPSNKAAWGQRSDDERAATCRGLSFGRLPFPEGKTAASQGLQRTLGQGRTGGGMRKRLSKRLETGPVELCHCRQRLAPGPADPGQTGRGSEPVAGRGHYLAPSGAAPLNPRHRPNGSDAPIPKARVFAAGALLTLVLYYPPHRGRWVFRTCSPRRVYRKDWSWLSHSLIACNATSDRCARETRERRRLRLKHIYTVPQFAVGSQ